VERIGFEESCRLGYRRGGPVRIVVARATYKIVDDTGKESLVTVDKPKELFRRGLLAPSLIAHILVAKYRFGIPFFRLSKMLSCEGLELDDSTTCRYAEDAGATLGVIVDACAAEAKKTAFCLATDATGVSIQPEPLATGARQPCKKGHFFVILADKDHVFFEYKKKHTSDAVCDLFRGFSVSRPRRVCRRGVVDMARVAAEIRHAPHYVYPFAVQSPALDRRGRPPGSRRSRSLRQADWRLRDRARTRSTAPVCVA
jgi:transposase